MRYLEKAALAGAATGMRSTVAVAALMSAGAPGLPRALTAPVAAGVAGLGVTEELEQDKNPSAPSRLSPIGLGGRVALASAAGAVLARGARRAVLPAVFLSSVAALVSARVCHDLRVAAAKRFQPDAVASVEDALALSLASASARP